MLLPADQRRALGAFLRTRRESLTPAAVGEPALFGGRRRTPGLRREEVAQLCGLSTTWYTWIEQGRDISLSPASLARLAAALRLTAAERLYLFDLTHHRDPSSAAPTDSAPTPVPAALDAVLQAATIPAYFLDRLWSVRAWNAAAAHLFASWLRPRALSTRIRLPGSDGATFHLRLGGSCPSRDRGIPGRLRPLSAGSRDEGIS